MHKIQIQLKIKSTTLRFLLKKLLILKKKFYLFFINAKKVNFFFKKLIFFKKKGLQKIPILKSPFKFKRAWNHIAVFSFFTFLTIPFIFKKVSKNLNFFFKIFFSFFKKQKNLGVFRKSYIF